MEKLLSVWDRELDKSTVWLAINKCQWVYATNQKYGFMSKFKNVSSAEEALIKLGYEKII